MPGMSKVSSLNIKQFTKNLCNLLTLDNKGGGIDQFQSIEDIDIVMWEVHIILKACYWAVFTYM
mgnify:CR=1 FL=1